MQLEDFISYFLTSASTAVRCDVTVIDFLIALDLVRHSSFSISGQSLIKCNLFI